MIAGLLLKNRNTFSPFVLFFVFFRRITAKAIPPIKKIQNMPASMLAPVTLLSLGKAGMKNTVSDEMKKQTVQRRNSFDLSFILLTITKNN
ncbi:MAG TPA: hypothetical protein PLD48_03430 [Bacillota bacterium]|nr:hypothetical protein [Bacillota bacterium]HOK68916.1 hypothetical protein [Bacillota bacterium]HPP84721.1 hypothetical protein [Bacillota bacterium]